MRSMSETRKIFTYLRRGAGRGARGEGITATDESGSSGIGLYPSPLVPRPALLFRPSLFEDAGNHLIQRRVLHAHVQHGVAIQDRPEDVGHPAARDFQVGRRPFGPDDFAEAV